MHLSLLIATAPLALASTHLNVLQARQGSDAFRPGIAGFVTNCQNICGEDICLRPERGDTCCVEGYGYPGGSFCLKEGYCCPDGDDPATCASRFGVTLPSGFQPGQTVAADPASSAAAPGTTHLSSATAPVATPSTSASTIHSSTTPVVVAPTSTSTTVYYPTPSNATTSALASASPPGGQTPGVVPFTGGANAIRFVLGRGRLIRVHT